MEWSALCHTVRLWDCRRGGSPLSGWTGRDIDLKEKHHLIPKGFASSDVIIQQRTRLRCDSQAANFDSALV